MFKRRRGRQPVAIHELLVAIETARKDRVLDDPAIVAALDKIPSSERARWAELVELAGAKPGEGSPLRSYIVQVRNNLAAHYYQPKPLFVGYQKFFFVRDRDQFNESGMASVGDHLRATRFYFADAAAQMSQLERDPDDTLVKELHQYVLAMFSALRFLIEAYMVLKQDQLISGTETGVDHAK